MHYVYRYGRISGKNRDKGYPLQQKRKKRKTKTETQRDHDSHVSPALPLLALALVTSNIQRRNRETIALSTSLTITRVLLNTNRHIKTISTSKTSANEALRRSVIGTSAELALVQGLARVLGRGEVRVVHAADAISSSAGRRVRVGLGDDGVVPAGHGGLVGISGLGLDARLANTGVLVEELEQGFVSFVVEMVDLVALGEQVGDGGGRGLVGDGRADDVGHVAPVGFGGDVELGLAVEAAQGGQVDVAAEDGDAHGVLLGQALEAVD